VSFERRSRNLGDIGFLPHRLYLAVKFDILNSKIIVITGPFLLHTLVKGKRNEGSRMEY